MALEEARELLRRGWSVSMVTLGDEKEHSFMSELPPACERRFVRCTSIFDIAALRVLARTFRDIDPDLIITQLWFANTVGRIAAVLGKLDQRVVSFEQNVYDGVKSWRQFMADRLLQYACRKIVAISGSVRGSLMRHGIAPERVVVIHNAIDLQGRASATPAPLRAEYAITQPFVYLSVARLVRQKGHDVLLAAFAKQKDAALVIVGDGELKAALLQQAHRLGIADRVHFLGIRKDIPELMRAADCFVLASRWEGFGIVLVEAMAAGLPIVATRVDGIVEVVEEGKSGLLVPPENVLALAEALRSMREDAELRNRIAAAVQNRAKSFSIERHVAKVLALL